MGEKRTFFCDIDESEIGVQRLSFIVVPEMGKAVELDVCADCRNNLPLSKIIEDGIGKTIRKSEAAFDVPRKKRGKGGTSPAHTQAVRDSARMEITCTECGTVVHGGQGYAAHWNAAHPGKEYPGYGPYECPECPARQISRKALVSHLISKHDIHRSDMTDVHLAALNNPEAAAEAAKAEAEVEGVSA